MELLSSVEGELNEATEEQLIEISNALATKTDGVFEFVDKQKKYLESIDSRIKDLMELKRSVTAEIKRFDTYVVKCLDLLGKKSVEGIYSKINIPKQREKLRIINEDVIPDEYMRTKVLVEIDKIKLLKALKDGLSVDGATITLGEKKPTYRIRSGFKK